MYLIGSKKQKMDFLQNLENRTMNVNNKCKKYVFKITTRIIFLQLISLKI